MNISKYFQLRYPYKIAVLFILISYFVSYFIGFFAHLARLDVPLHHPVMIFMIISPIFTSVIFILIYNFLYEKNEKIIDNDNAINIIKEKGKNIVLWISVFVGALPVGFSWAYAAYSYHEKNIAYINMEKQKQIENNKRIFISIIHMEKDKLEKELEVKTLIMKPIISFMLHIREVNEDICKLNNKHKNGLLNDKEYAKQKNNLLEIRDKYSSKLVYASEDMLFNFGNVFNELDVKFYDENNRYNDPSEACETLNAKLLKLQRDARKIVINQRIKIKNNMKLDNLALKAKKIISIADKNARP